MGKKKRLGKLNDGKKKKQPAKSKTPLMVGAAAFFILASAAVNYYASKKLVNRPELTTSLSQPTPARQNRGVDLVYEGSDELKRFGIALEPKDSVGEYDSLLKARPSLAGRIKSIVVNGKDLSLNPYSGPDLAEVKQRLGETIEKYLAEMQSPFLNLPHYEFKTTTDIKKPTQLRKSDDTFLIFLCNDKAFRVSGYLDVTLVDGTSLRHPFSVDKTATYFSGDVAGQMLVGQLESKLDCTEYFGVGGKGVYYDILCSNIYWPVDKSRPALESLVLPSEVLHAAMTPVTSGLIRADLERMRISGNTVTESSKVEVRNSYHLTEEIFVHSMLAYLFVSLGDAKKYGMNELEVLEHSAWYQENPQRFQQTYNWIKSNGAVKSIERFSQDGFR